MHKILTITRNEIAKGFTLTGVEVIYTKNNEEAKKVLLENMNNKDYGIIIIEEDFYQELDSELKKLMDKGNIPLVIPLPIGMKWREIEPSYKSNYISELIKRSIGYEIKLT